MLSILPLLLMLVVMLLLYSGLTKLAAQIYKRASLRWKHALIYGGLATFISLLLTVANKSSGTALGSAIWIALGLVLHVALGGWYLGPRVASKDGSPILFKGGAVIAAIAFGFTFLLGVAAAVIIPTLTHTSQA